MHDAPIDHEMFVTLYNHIAEYVIQPSYQQDSGKSAGECADRHFYFHLHPLMMS